MASDPAAGGGAGVKLQGKLLSVQDKRFSVRLLDSSLLDVCLKFVGNGSSVCAAVGCKTNHAESSAPLKLEVPTVFIMKSKDRAFADLTLEGSLVPENVLRIWESTTWTLNDWHEAFLAVDLQDEGDFDNQVLEIQRAGTFKTPGKQRNSASDALSSFVPYPSALRTNASKESLKRSPANFPKLGETLVAVDDGLVGLAASFQGLIVESRERSDEFAETSRMLALKISRTHKLIGSMSVMSSSDYAAPTLWSSLAAMGSDVQSLLLKSVPAAPVVNLQPLWDRMSSMESDVSSGSDKLKHQVINMATNLGGRVGKIGTAVKRLNSRGFGAGGNHDAALAARFQNLERRVQELDSKLFKALADAESESIKFGGLGLI
jgi:hypothetical protein